MPELGLSRIEEDARVLEVSSGYCVVISGNHKGVCFLKSNNSKKEIKFIELPFDLQKKYNDYYADTATKNPDEIWKKKY